MKKKLTAVILSLACALCCVFGLIACDETEHTHDYGTAWSKSDTHHWHECKNDGCDEKEKDKAAHTWDAGEITAPATEAGSGVKTFTCTVCEKTKTETIPYVSHQHDSDAETVAEEYKVSDADCTNKAVYYKSCSVCGKKGTATFETGNSNGHKFTAETVAEKYKVSDADCANKAVYYRSCLVCGEIGTETFTTGEPTGLHDYTAETVAEKYKVSDADCTHKAVYKKSCVTCEAEGTETFTTGEPTGIHNFTVETVAEKYKKSDATCTRKAIYYKSCTVCGEKGGNDDTFETGEAPVGHNFGGGTVCTVCSAHEGSADLEYEVIGNEATLKSRGTCEDVNIYIADTYQGYPVTAIADNAFRSADIKSVAIPDSVQSIGDGAFAYCIRLTEVIIPDSVTTITQDAFYNCNGLTIYCKASSKPSGFANEWNDDCAVVWGCETNRKDENGYEYVIFNDIRYALKEGVATVTTQPNMGGNLVIAESVTHQGNTYSVKSIALNAFVGCRDLTGITIPNGVRSIGNYAFYGCSNLRDFTFTANAGLIGSIFASDENAVLENITFIGTFAEWCRRSDLQNLMTIGKAQKTLTVDGTKVQGYVEILDEITSINAYAFYGCHELETICLPGTVTAIKSNAFYGCDALGEVVYDGTLAQWCSQPMGLSNLMQYGKAEKRLYVGGVEITGDFIIPAEVTMFGTYAFYGCNALTSVTIHGNMSWIGRNAFGGCHGLTIYCEAERKPSEWDFGWNGVNEAACPIVWNCTTNKKDNMGNEYAVIDGIRYAFKDGAAAVAKQPMLNSYTVTLPESVLYDGIEYSVTKIMASAFEGYWELCEINIPSTVTYIGSSAFSGCNSLTEIIIPISVTYIGSSAFKNCSGLTIYCKAEQEASEWYRTWNGSCPVVLNCDVSNTDYFFKEYVIIDGIRYELISGGIAAVATQPKNIGPIMNVKSSITHNGGTYNVDSIAALAFADCPYLESIFFDGTKEQWDALRKGNDWNKGLAADFEVVFMY